jgi:hypothetical protein
MSWSRRAADVCMAAALVYLAVWIYELSNLAVLSAVGSQASMAFVGILPVGVSALNPDAQLLAVAKPVQVLLCGAVMFGLLYAIRSKGLPISTTLASATLSIYLASSYWEMLSLVGSSSYLAHVSGFTVLALATQAWLSRALKI